MCPGIRGKLRERGAFNDLRCGILNMQTKIERIVSNMIDLAYLLLRKRLFYHWQFNGSYSIAVLPALVPDSL